MVFLVPFISKSYRYLDFFFLGVRTITEVAERLVGKNQCYTNTDFVGQILPVVEGDKVIVVLHGTILMMVIN